MRNVPKIVTERLKAAAVAAHHPEAEVLTAFAERSLPEREREIVLEHVARCGECREVLALALPETEAAASAPSPVRTPWLAWPALRWGLVTAGGLAIAAFGVVQYQRRADVVNTVARQSQNEPAMAPNGAESVARTEPPKSAARSSDAVGARLAEATPRTNLATRAEPEPVPPTSRTDAGNYGGGQTPAVIARSLPHGPRMLQQQSQQQSQLQASASGLAVASAKQQSDELAANRIPASAEAVEVQGKSAQLDNQPENKDGLAEAQAPADKKSLDAIESLKVDKAKPAAPASAETAQVSASAAPAATATAGEPQQLPAQAGNSGVSGGSLTQFAVLSPGRTPSPSWIITAAGALERSFDHGATWQSVDVNAANPVAANLTDAEISLTRARKSRDEKKVASAQAASPVFRTVAAAGTEVWAGGSNGALYHSLDAGTRWVRVVPLSGAAPLTGDIVSLEFSDSRHGRLTTSTAEVWTTADDGQTWQKQ